MADCYCDAMQGEAYACCNLGVLHYRQRQYDDALTYFERFFEAARALKDQHVLDVARLNLGSVRAALNFQDYVQVRADGSKLTTYIEFCLDEGKSSNVAQNVCPEESCVHALC